MQLKKQNIVVLTGAGISAESGISTFRDAGGLWEGYAIEAVASPIGWKKNPQVVLQFYNERRRQILLAKPNKAHKALVQLENHFHVSIITQNIDHLHEQAGSTNVMHLHGEILKSRSSKYEHLIYPCLNDILIGDVCEKGEQLRPFIVWFGEEVPLLEEAIAITKMADILIIIGTSMVVYPAASLVQFALQAKHIYVINPQETPLPEGKKCIFIKNTAVNGVPQLVEKICANLNQSTFDFATIG